MTAPTVVDVDAAVAALIGPAPTDADLLGTGPPREQLDAHLAPDWVARRVAARAFVALATRAELAEWALRQFDRAEIGWCAELLGRAEADQWAQHQASHAISEAVDWSAQSLWPSHAELERRRAKVGPMCRGDAA